MNRSSLLLFATIGSLAVMGVSHAQVGAAAATGVSDSVAVRSLDKGGKLIVREGFQTTFGTSKLTADRAVGFSPDGVLWSADRLENVVIEGGGLGQPLFMPEATLSSSAGGQPMLVSDSVTTASKNTMVTYSCTDGVIYANGVSTGQDHICLGPDFVVECSPDGQHVVTIRTQHACINN
ncbi:MAG: hypothetical protein ACREPN_06505 [Rudaea sp.]